MAKDIALGEITGKIEGKQPDFQQNPAYVSNIGWKNTRGKYIPTYWWGGDNVTGVICFGLWTIYQVIICFKFNVSPHMRYSYQKLCFVEVGHTMELDLETRPVNPNQLIRKNFF